MELRIFETDVFTALLQLMMRLVGAKTLSTNCGGGVVILVGYAFCRTHLVTHKYAFEWNRQSASATRIRLEFFFVLMIFHHTFDGGSYGLDFGLNLLTAICAPDLLR